MREDVWCGRAQLENWTVVQPNVRFGSKADIGRDGKRKTASRRSLRKFTSVLTRSSLRGTRRQHCSCRGPRHQHSKYDRNENERRRISH